MGLSKIKRVAMDTNMLLAIEKLRIDVFEEVQRIYGKVEFVIPMQVKNELEMLSSKSKTRKREVNIAKKILEKYDVKEVKVDSENADDALFELAKNGVIVATNDKELKRRIRNIPQHLIYIRQKKYIVGE